MQQMQMEHLTREWCILMDSASPEAIELVRQVVQQRAAELADFFYNSLLADPLPAAFLSHQEVKDRLHSALQSWLLELFSLDQQLDFEALFKHQQQVGEVHARVEIPVSLVMRGAHLIKSQLRKFLQQQVPQDLLLLQQADTLSSGLIELALEGICFAFSTFHDRHSRAEEAYRLFSVAHNVGAEKERQRAALLDWENQLMFDLATGNLQPTCLSSAEFGLWFRHKASYVFQGTLECQTILRHLEELDQTVPHLIDSQRQGQPAQVLSQLHQIRDQVRAIKFLLETLFDQASNLEAGRDTLTQLLNRRFLPVVLSKELLHSRQSSTQFAVLAVDVDHFKTINDQYGHDVGDQVLQQMAALLARRIRGGDYAFRMGGEEFLLLLVDVAREQALRIAEKLCQTVSRERFSLTVEGQFLQVTISIGVAIYDGHPDYAYLLKQADQALYKAKSAGRNRVVLSE